MFHEIITWMKHFFPWLIDVGGVLVVDMLEYNKTLQADSAKVQD